MYSQPTKWTTTIKAFNQLKEKPYNSQDLSTTYKGTWMRHPHPASPTTENKVGQQCHEASTWTSANCIEEA